MFVPEVLRGCERTHQRSHQAHCGRRAGLILSWVERAGEGAMLKIPKEASYRVPGNIFK